MDTIKRSKKEIDTVLNEAVDHIGSGTTKFSGLSYEEGLREMYYWLTQDEPDVNPME